jgi:predicted nucleic acid-binding Zn ribbon protein
MPGSEEMPPSPSGKPEVAPADFSVDNARRAADNQASMEHRDGNRPADDADPQNDGPLIPPVTPPAASSRGNDAFPDASFIDVDAADAPAEIALQACPFCRRATRADADVCHRCGNFLLRDEEASDRRRACIARWSLAMGLFGLALWLILWSKLSL